MTNLRIALIAAFLLATAAIPIAAADEHEPTPDPNPEIGSEGKADCEENQQWIGYTTSDSTRNFTRELLEGTADVQLCEGEHWDGEDTVDETEGSRDQPCTDVNEASPEGAQVSNCQPSDPNQGAPSVGTGVVGVRLSTTHDTGAQQAYWATDIYGVGKAVLYVGHCDGSSGGLEGDGCAGAQQSRTGIYLQDNSDQSTGDNVLATVVSAAGITRGYPAEGDCSQTTYAQGANENNRTKCGRDNTAITLDVIVPAGDASASSPAAFGLIADRESRPDWLSVLP